MLKISVSAASACLTILMISSGSAQASEAPRGATIVVAQQSEAAAGYVSYKENKKALSAKLPGGLTADKLIGADIVSPTGDDVGEIGDLLVEKNGQANNVVVDVGGFLGIGGKNVVLDLNTLSPAKGSDDDLVTNMTKEQLKALPAYEKKGGTWVLKTGSSR
jgi:hypothetical protein